MFSIKNAVHKLLDDCLDEYMGVVEITETVGVRCCFVNIDISTIPPSLPVICQSCGAVHEYRGVADYTIAEKAAAVFRREYLPQRHTIRVYRPKRGG